MAINGLLHKGLSVAEIKGKVLLDELQARMNIMHIISYKYIYIYSIYYILCKIEIRAFRAWAAETMNSSKCWCCRVSVPGRILMSASRRNLSKPNSPQTSATAVTWKSFLLRRLARLNPDDHGRSTINDKDNCCCWYVYYKKINNNNRIF